MSILAHNLIRSFQLETLAEPQHAHAPVPPQEEVAVGALAGPGLLRGKGFSLLLDMYPANISGVQSALVVAGAYLRERPDVVERVVAGLIEGIAFSLAPQNEETVRKTLMARMKISAPAAAESSYRNFLTRANHKPYASIAAMQNMRRVMALNDPKVLKREDRGPGGRSLRSKAR